MSYCCVHKTKAKYFCNVSFNTSTTHMWGIIVVNFQCLCMFIYVHDYHDVKKKHRNKKFVNVCPLIAQKHDFGFFNAYPIRKSKGFGTIKCVKHAEGCKVDSRHRLHRFILCTRSFMGTALRVGLTASQLYLPFLTRLSVAGCGRLQLGVADWATSWALLQVVDNWHHKRCSSILLWRTPTRIRLYFFYCNQCSLNLCSDEMLVNYKHFEFWCRLLDYLLGQKML